MLISGMSSSVAHPTLLKYARLWWDTGRKGSVDLFGTIATMVGLGLWYWNGQSPDSFKAAAALFRISPESAMSDWVWQVPLLAGGLALAWRFIRAPYEIHLETLRAHESQRTESARALAEASNKLAGLEAQNIGVDLACGQMTMYWGDDPDLPPGVLVAVDVNRLVNGNTFEVALQLKLVLPLWRLSPGSFSINTSAPLLASSYSSVRSRLPQICGIVSLGKKQATGPGFLLFFFGHESVRKNELIPQPVRDLSLEEFAVLVRDAELHIEISDVANNVMLPHVLAPGTLQKRFDRMQREQTAASEGQDSLSRDRGMIAG